MAEAERDGREEVARPTGFEVEAPAAAARLSPNDLLRVVRALEDCRRADGRGAERALSQAPAHPPGGELGRHRGVARGAVRADRAKRTEVDLRWTWSKKRAAGEGARVELFRRRARARRLGSTEAPRRRDHPPRGAVPSPSRPPGDTPSVSVPGFARRKQIRWLSPGEVPIRDSLTTHSIAGATLPACRSSPTISSCRSCTARPAGGTPLGVREILARTGLSQGARTAVKRALRELVRSHSITGEGKQLRSSNGSPLRTARAARPGHRPATSPKPEKPEPRRAPKPCAAAGALRPPA